MAPRVITWVPARRAIKMAAVTSGGILDVWGPVMEDVTDCPSCSGGLLTIHGNDIFETTIRIDGSAHEQHELETTIAEVFEWTPTSFVERGGGGRGSLVNRREVDGYGDFGFPA